MFVLTDDLAWNLIKFMPNVRALEQDGMTATGRVLGWIDLAKLLPEAQLDRLKDRGGVANGIAYDRATDRVLVTGKYWPYLFQLDSIPGVASPRPSRRPARP